MPKFIYTILFADLVFWFFWIRALVTTKPDISSNILVFLLLLFSALGLGLSLVFYFIFFKRAPTFTNLKYLYRRALKYGMFMSSGVVILMGLKAFGVLTPINLGLYVLLFYLVFNKLRHKR